MIGVNRKLQVRDGVGPVISPATPNRVRTSRWHLAAVAALFVPLSFMLAQCGRAPSAGMLAANTQASSGDTFEDRFPAPQFRDRFPTERESFAQRPVAVAGQTPAAMAPQPQRSPRTEPVRVASIAPTLTLPRQTERDELTTLVGMKSSAFPYFGNNPRSEIAVPQRHQGRAQGPSQLFGAGLLAGRDLQRQPRAGACPRRISTRASPA